MTSSILNRLLGVHTIPCVLLTVGLLIGVDGLPATAGQRAGSYTVETFRVGLAPFGLAFDGANIWVANSGSDTVTKLRASDGVVLGTFSVGDNPSCIAFDGANVWITNSLGNSVTRLRASDGAHRGTFSVGGAPVGCLRWS